jgi:CAAX protease family protein
VTEPQELSGVIPDSTPQLPVPSPRNGHTRLTELFFGAEGLRSGWGFVLYLALVFALFTTARRLNPALHRLAGTVWLYLAQEIVVVICAALPAVAMSRIERRSVGAYGLPARGAFGKMFVWGVVWGFVALSLLLVALRGSHAFYFGSVGVHGIKALKFALFWALMFLLVGFFEEFLFRGYALFTLRRGIGFWPAALALSALFGLVHLGNQGESWRGALAAGLIGLFFCFTVLRTGNLWFAVGLHASWDWAESYFYGVPDSGTMVQGHLLNASFHGPAWLTGGTVGPEGSVLVFVVIGILFASFHATHPAKSGTSAAEAI